ncbi:hypothetical protein T484DRAFT_1753036 [Baffinella frigidus]|nr:hypothetical protein T484DRAFT_1753036 [Cryptophyta sp. CCMP2293]
MPWRDIIFTGDGIILPPSWNESGLNDAASFATGGIVLPPSISQEERGLLDMLASTEMHFEVKPRSPSNATGESNDDAFSTASTPCISRCESFEMDTTPYQSRRTSAAQ